MGVVGLPARVTGLAAISIMAEITFIPGFQASSNSSQRGRASGLSCRLILRTTLLAISFCLPYLIKLQQAHHGVQDRDPGEGPVDPVMARDRRPEQDAA